MYIKGLVWLSRFELICINYILLQVSDEWKHEKDCNIVKLQVLSKISIPDLFPLQGYLIQ